MNPDNLNTAEFRQLQLLKDSEKGKVLLVADPATQRRFILRSFHGSPEAYLRLRSVSSPYLPKILEVTSREDTVQVLEEYIPGDNLQDLLECGLLSRRQAADILLQLCNAMAALHGNSLVHRDIKPDNIIINGKRPVLIDFDATRVYKHAQTADTHVLGTTGFAAPEQYGLGQTDGRSDIFAAGVLLNIMLTGKHPSERLAPGRLGRVVRRCTMMNQDQRYQTAGALKRGLLLELALPYILGLAAAMMIACCALWLKAGHTAASLPEEPTTAPSAIESAAPSVGEAPQAATADPDPETDTDSAPRVPLHEATTDAPASTYPDSAEPEGSASAPPPEESAIEQPAEPEPASPDYGFHIDSTDGSLVGNDGFCFESYEQYLYLVVPAASEGTPLTGITMVAGGELSFDGTHTESELSFVLPGIYDSFSVGQILPDDSESFYSVWLQPAFKNHCEGELTLTAQYENGSTECYSIPLRISINAAE